jgi:RHS repeat-associated protein
VKKAKHYAFLALVAALGSSCRINVVVDGEGMVNSPNGTFRCTDTGGDCEETYTEPNTETLVAMAAPGHRFSRWRGCNYRDITSCTTTISRHALDNDEQWTITAEFEPVESGIRAAQYTYNAMGQRITKTVDDTTTLFQYNLQGRLIAELDTAGRPLREHIYLDGEPVAQVTTRPDGSKFVHYVHTDHLGSPVLLTDRTGRVRWDHAATPFGQTYINYAEVEYNLRFPGQYYDGESGLHYNYFRDYDPVVGRYIQADPIGLAGGMNAYTYAYGNPLALADPYGLAPPWVAPAAAVFSATGGTLALHPSPAIPPQARLAGLALAGAGGMLQAWDIATAVEEIEPLIEKDLEDIQDKLDKLNDLVEPLSDSCI